MAEVAIIGLGFVGGAMFKSFTEKGVNVYGYDKYKDGLGCERSKAKRYMWKDYFNFEC